MSIAFLAYTPSCINTFMYVHMHGCMGVCGMHMHVCGMHVFVCAYACMFTCLFPSVKVISVYYYAQHCFEFGESRDWTQILTLTWKPLSPLSYSPSYLLIVLYNLFIPYHRVGSWISMSFQFKVPKMSVVGPGSQLPSMAWVLYCLPDFRTP